MTPKRFMVIAGEPSGDMLAAELVRELRAGIGRLRTYTDDLQPLAADLAPRFFGAGGQRMAEAGVELATDMTSHAVIGLDLVRSYSTFNRIFHDLFRLAAEREPDVIICVDFGLFNGLFAKAVKNYVRARRGPFHDWNPLLVQYVSPQVWGSREGRAYRIARDFDLLLCLFPFEKDWYARRVPRLHVEFVGHPMLDRYPNAGIAQPGTDASKPNVLLLPGSRKAELRRHLPVMMGALQTIQAAFPETKATMVLTNDRLAAVANAHGVGSAPKLKIQVGGLADVLSQSTIAISKTGTASMECALFGVPTVTLYKVFWVTYQFGKRIATVPFLTMPNLLAGEAVFPEFIQNDATAANIGRAALELLRDESRRQRIKARLREIVASLGGPGASRRAAQAILKRLLFPSN